MFERGSERHEPGQTESILAQVDSLQSASGGERLGQSDDTGARQPVLLKSETQQRAIALEPVAYEADHALVAERVVAQIERLQRFIGRLKTSALVTGSSQ